MRAICGMMVIAGLIFSACASRQATVEPSLGGDTDRSDAAAGNASGESAPSPEEPLAHAPGQAVVTLDGDAEPPTVVGLWRCEIVAAAGSGVVALFCVDEAGEPAPVEPLCEALETLPGVRGAEPNHNRRTFR